MASSSSGLGRRPLKAEIAGSNPVEATRIPNPHVNAGFLFYPQSLPIKELGYEIFIVGITLARYFV